MEVSVIVESRLPIRSHRLHLKRKLFISGQDKPFRNTKVSKEEAIVTIKLLQYEVFIQMIKQL